MTELSQEEIKNLELFPKETQSDDEFEKLKKENEKLKSQLQMIVSSETRIMNPIEDTQMRSMAKKMIIDKAMPRGYENESQLFMAMKIGTEMGLKPIQAINSLYHVNGRFQLWGESLGFLITRAGYKIEWKTATNKLAEVFVSKGDEKHYASFSIDRAIREERLNKKGSLWKQFPENLLRFNALREVLKFSIPHIVGANIYIEGDEEVIDKQHVPQEQKLEIMNEIEQAKLQNK
jgi:hypothetical protein